MLVRRIPLPALENTRLYPARHLGRLLLWVSAVSSRKRHVGYTPDTLGISNSLLSVVFPRTVNWLDQVNCQPRLNKTNQSLVFDHDAEILYNLDPDIGEALGHVVIAYSQLEPYRFRLF